MRRRKWERKNISVSPASYRNHAVMHGEVVLDCGVRCICMRCHLRDLHVPIEKKTEEPVSVLPSHGRSWTEGEKGTAGEISNNQGAQPDR
jgi:hypothetical protein